MSSPYMKDISTFRLRIVVYSNITTWPSDIAFYKNIVSITTIDLRPNRWPFSLEPKNTYGSTLPYVV